MNVVTRFAPSPTGFLHIGGARTALFNWLFARHHGGTYLLRIEDTDRARSTAEAIEAIHDGLSWLGLEGDTLAVSQSAQAPRHAKVAMQLVEAGAAYRCYLSDAELESIREKACAEGKPVRSPWRDRTDRPDAAFVVRMKMPDDGVMTIEDAVQGSVTVQHAQLDDMVILRANGSPTYMLAVVVDDVVDQRQGLARVVVASVVVDVTQWWLVSEQVVRLVDERLVLVVLGVASGEGFDLRLVAPQRFELARVVNVVSERLVVDVLVAVAGRGWHVPRVDVLTQHRCLGVVDAIAEELAVVDGELAAPSLHEPHIHRVVPLRLDGEVAVVVGPVAVGAPVGGPPFR